MMNGAMVQVIQLLWKALVRPFWDLSRPPLSFIMLCMKDIRYMQTKSCRVLVAGVPRPRVPRI